MSNEKYGCFKVSTVEDRCIKLAYNSSYDPSFPTKTECIKKCNTPEEEEALTKLKEKFKLKDLVKKLRPEILLAFDSIKDIPLLNYKGNPYNKKVFNNDELRHFYRIINLRTNNEKHPNKFLDDLIKKFNCTYGKNNYFSYNDEDVVVNKIISPEEEEAELLEEILKFKSSSYKFLIKDIITNNVNSEISHISLLLIKKENIEGKDSLTFFIFDPAAGGLMWLYNQIESLINKVCTTKSINHRVIQLSKFFGIQSYERNQLLLDDHSYSIAQLFSNVKKDVNQDIDTFNKTFVFDIVIEIAKKYISSSHIDLPVGDQSMGELIFPKDYIIYNYDYPQGDYNNLKEIIKSHPVLIDIFSPKKGWIKQNIALGFVKLEDLKSMEEMLVKIGRSKFRNIFKNHLFEEDIDNYIKKYINDLFSNNFKEPFVPLHDVLYEKLLTLSSKEFGIIKKIADFRTKINVFYDFDYFSGYCYMWCYYIIILILMNESIDPYVIIKATFFQTKDKDIMKKIIDDYLGKEEDDENKKKDNIFHKDFVTHMNQYIENGRKDMSTLYEPVTIELRRTLFYKITNLQTLNILYNKTFDKYINYSIVPPGEKYYSVTKFIPQKADELLNDFILPGVDSSLGLVELREAIINTVIAGELLPKVNEKINATLPRGTLTYEEKYRKYKQKYLMLKSLLKN